MTTNPGDFPIAVQALAGRQFRMSRANSGGVRGWALLAMLSRVSFSLGWCVVVSCTFFADSSFGQTPSTGIQVASLIGNLILRGRMGGEGFSSAKCDRRNEEFAIEPTRRQLLESGE
jgi:hypothetical protein